MIDSVSTAPQLFDTDMSFDDYLKIPALNSSTIKAGRTSMKHMRAAVLGKMEKDDSRHMKLGSAIHCALLEGMTAFRERYKVAPQCSAELKSKDKKGQQCSHTATCYVDGEPRCGVHSPKDWPIEETFITQAEYNSVERVREAVLTDPYTGVLHRRGGCEKTITWSEHIPVLNARGEVVKVPIDYKARLDKWCPPQSFLRKGAVIDLKKCQRDKIDLDDCQHAVRKHLYHWQMAMYIDGIKAFEGLDEDPEGYWVFVEDSEPHDVFVLKCDPVTLQMGREEYRDQVNKYAKAIAQDFWPGVMEKYQPKKEPEDVRGEKREKVIPSGGLPERDREAWIERNARKHEGAY